jgi:hypothetical protein
MQCLLLILDVSSIPRMGTGGLFLLRGGCEMCLVAVGGTP